MRRPCVALYTFGIFARPSSDPVNDGFRELDPVNLRAVEVSDGFLGRSGYDGEPGPECWGAQIYPRFYVERGDGWSPSTLSKWRDLESIYAFTYSGIHLEALKRGGEWFVRPSWPPYVLWWIDSDHRPDWREGVERMEHLHDHGPSARAFNFKKPFDEGGNPTTLDRDLVKAKSRLNAERLEGLGLV
ncbi:DUF3291 domain-containing protein [Stappia sp. F7233]|uniref:DUF3291 domain-containing protein n=1 Tax=Stappia albiluteola TaxID=2758565 RepID=A0A839AAG3_9HYPH|nr:DUF3291 domain-containing protein [Stappia albiluteola]MBA5776563.1 DUF3291 domain-containing protein [Stappia albiluteola]